MPCQNGELLLSASKKGQPDTDVKCCDTFLAGLDSDVNVKNISQMLGGRQAKTLCNDVIPCALHSTRVLCSRN